MAVSAPSVSGSGIASTVELIHESSYSGALSCEHPSRYDNRTYRVTIKAEPGYSIKRAGYTYETIGWNEFTGDTGPDQHVVNDSFDECTLQISYDIDLYEYEDYAIEWKWDEEQQQDVCSGIGSKWQSGSCYMVGPISVTTEKLPDIPVLVTVLPMPEDASDHRCSVSGNNQKQESFVVMVTPGKPLKIELEAKDNKRNPFLEWAYVTERSWYDYFYADLGYSTSDSSDDFDRKAKKTTLKFLALGCAVPFGSSHSPGSSSSDEFLSIVIYGYFNIKPCTGLILRSAKDGTILRASGNLILRDCDADDSSA